MRFLHLKSWKSARVLGCYQVFSSSYNRLARNRAILSLFRMDFLGVIAMMFHVVLHSEEDGWIVAECPALPGCVSQGKDEKEALANIREAITGWLWAEDQKAS